MAVTSITFPTPAYPMFINVYSDDCLMSSLSELSGLSFDSSFLSPVLFFCLVIVLFLKSLGFFLLIVHSPDFFPENSLTFFFL